MSAKSIIKTITGNATFAAVLGATVGGLIGYVAKDMQVHDAVTYNNISSYIKSELVDPGYVSEEVLEKENPFQQISFIGQDVSGKLKEANDKSAKVIGSVQTFLIDCGENESLVKEMDVKTLDKALKKQASKSKELQSQFDEANEKLGKYDNLIMAEMKTPVAIISGEQYSNPIQDYQAIINGHNYYLDEFLNSFLEYDLTYEDGYLYYHKGTAERVKVTENMFYDNTGDIRVLSDEDTYSMELKSYSTGLRFYDNGWNYGDGEIKLSCKKEYSAIEFKVGHIDDKSSYEKDIIISYQDEDGNFLKAETIHCTGDMPVHVCKVPIYNTNTVKITSKGGGNYLFTDIYLIK